MGGYNAIIEGDSISAIQWDSKRSSYPWLLVDEVQDISDQLGDTFHHVLHEVNDIEDHLAREQVFCLIISYDVLAFFCFFDL